MVWHPPWNPHLRKNLPGARSPVSAPHTASLSAPWPPSAPAPAGWAPQRLAGQWWRPAPGLWGGGAWAGSENDGKSMGNLWKIYGNRRKSMEIYGNLWEIYANRWKSMGNLWEIYGNLSSLWEILGGEK